MEFFDAVRTAVAAMRTRPSAIVPLVLIGTSVGLIGQVVLLVGGLTAYGLAPQGRLGRVFDALAALDFEAIADGSAEPADVTALDRLVAAMVALFTPEVIAVLGLTVLVFVVVVLLASAVVAAGQVHVSVAVLNEVFGGSSSKDETRLIATGVVGTRRDLAAFAWLGLTGLLLQALPLLVLVGVAIATTRVGDIATPAVLGLAIVGLLLWILYELAVALALLFVPQSIVVDGVGFRAALVRNAGFVGAHPWRTVAYGLFVVTLAVAIGVVTAALSVLSIPNTSAVLVLFLVVPFQILFKTGLYLDRRVEREGGEVDHVSAAESSSASGRIVAAFVRGWRELGAFVVEHPGLVALSFAFFGVGALLGWRVTVGFGLDIPTPTDPGAVFGPFPADVFAQITLNNWIVAIRQTYAGLGFGVPAATSLLTNGLIIGALASMGFDPVVFAALVVPHALLEVPALAVSGALGMHLGRCTWWYVRGRSTAEDLASAIVHAYFVLLGLLPVFVVAGFIEAFVTPWVATFVM